MHNIKIRGKRLQINSAWYKPKKTIVREFPQSRFLPLWTHVDPVGGEYLLFVVTILGLLVLLQNGYLKITHFQTVR